MRKIFMGIAIELFAVLLQLSFKETSRFAYYRGIGAFGSAFRSVRNPRKQIGKEISIVSDCKGLQKK